MFGNVLGVDGICPLYCFGKPKLELVGLISIGLDHGTQEFPSFSDFQLRDGGGGSVRATGQSEVTGRVGLVAIAPFAILPLEVNQTPITFLVGQGTTRDTENSFPIVQHGLHLSKNISTRGEVEGSSVEELGVINKVQAHQFDCFIGQGVPHVESKASSLHRVNNDRDESSASIHCSSIFLQQAHERGKKRIRTVVDRGVSKCSLNEVSRGLNCINHGLD